MVKTSNHLGFASASGQPVYNYWIIYIFFLVIDVSNIRVMKVVQTVFFNKGS